MHDRYSSCFSRANLRDACPGYWRDSQLWHVKSSNMQRETPKKICHDGESCFLCKRTFSVAKEKIRVFGKSSFDISSLIHRALNVDLTVYVDREQLAICRTQCYSRIVRYKNAVQKVEEIGGEIKRNFGGDFPFRVKRMAKKNILTHRRERSDDRKCDDRKCVFAGYISWHWELFFQNRSRELFPPITASMYVKFKRNL